MIQKSYEDSASLYLIPTPLGNLDDITVRSLKTLEMVDIILCEDTRDTGRLLQQYNLKKKLMSCHEHNEEKMVDQVISMLKEGKNIGLVTDQGTPIISDPGYLMAKEVIGAGFSVIPLPGACAFVPALIASGIEPSPFLYYGFLNAKKSKKEKELKALSSYKETLIFYESVHRLVETLEMMLEIFGNRNISVCRELTKIHEEFIRGKLSEVIPQIQTLKGEFVLVVEGNKEQEDYSHLTVVEHVQIYLEDGYSLNDAMKQVAKERNVSKSVIYKEYHNDRK